MRTGSPADLQSRAVVRLLLACDNACVFCGQDGVSTALPSVESQLAEARKASDAVTFAGGEPTLDPALVRHVASARALGFRRIGLQTNGRRLADEGSLVAELAHAGLTDIHLSVHGATSEVHNYHSGTLGSLAQAWRALAAARANGLLVVVTTVLTRSSFRVLAPLPELLTSKGVSAWLIAIPHARGRADAGFDRLIPRLGIALPFALHALDAARAIGLPAWIAGAPSCLLGPFAARALPTPPRAHAEVCTACPARPSCAGLDGAYLARFGGDELSPCALLESSKADRDLAAMFVGPGELAPLAETRPTRVSPVRMLPMLGKVQAARGEVTARSERRSGDALREILPQLFEPKTKG